MRKRLRVRPLDGLLIILIGLPLVASSLAKGATTVDVTVSLPPLPDPNPVVAIVHRETPPDEAEIATMVQEAVTAALGPWGLSALVTLSDTVVIKPNLGVGHATHRTADWTVVAPLAQMAWDAGAGRVVIAEGDEPQYSAAGYLDHMPPGTEFVDLSTGSSFYDVTVVGGYWSDPIIIPQLYFDADVVITVPAIKTHGNCGITIGLKNAVGVPPLGPYSSGGAVTWRRAMHDDYGIHGTVSQINLARQPDLVVVDGLEGCEGEGPWSCSSVADMNLILASRDPVAVDRVGLEVMGCEFCEPRRVAHQVYSAYKNLGVSDLAAIQVVGTPIEQVRETFVSPAFAEGIYRATTVVEALGAGSSMVVDGDLGDWGAVSSIALGDEVMVLIGEAHWAGTDDLSATARALYDSGDLYLAIEVRDDVALANTASDLWDGDGVEVYINSPDPWDVAFSHLAGGDEFWLGVAYAPSSTVWDIGRDRAVAGADAVVTDTVGGYIVELRIPWTALDGFQALENRQIGFDLALNDDDAGGGRQTWMSWGAAEAPSPPPGDSNEWGVARLGAEAHGPTGVGLSSFGAATHCGGILVTWETATETDNLGFNLYRADGPDASLTQLNGDLIPSQSPGSPLGAAYQFVDGSVAAGSAYYYWLEDVPIDGVATRYGPVWATAGPIAGETFCQYLPLVLEQP